METNAPPEITEIEEGAKRAGIKMSVLFRRAGIPPSTFWRWKHRKADPGLSGLKRVQAALRELVGEAA